MPKPKTRMHEDLDMEASVEELNALEEKFTDIVKERVAGNPELKFVFLVFKSDLAVDEQ